MKEITVEAKMENLDFVLDFVNEQLEENSCPLKVQTQLDIAIDELFSNVTHYAYTPQVGLLTLQSEMENGEICLTFIDRGIPYNPLEKQDPDIHASLSERPIGGLGIYLVKKTMDKMEYRYENGQNILTIRKKL